MSYSPPPTRIARAAWPPAPRLRWVERLALLAAGGALVGLLVTATRLTPSPRGMGTHEQLGLPPCTLVQWYGVRCPSCGMTTSWAHLMRGHVAAAFRANSGGALLALAAVISGPWLLMSGLRGKWLIAAPHELVTLAVGMTIVVVTLIDWTLRVSLGW